MKNDLYGFIVDYIENNKKSGIDYHETIDYLKELINELEREYKKEM